MNEPTASPTPITGDDLFRGVLKISAAVRELVNSGPASEAIAGFIAFHKNVTSVATKNSDAIRGAIEASKLMTSWTPADGYH